MNDFAVLKTMSSFIKQFRLEQNKTQALLAKEVGINKTALSLFENWMSSNLMITDKQQNTSYNK